MARRAEKLIAITPDTQVIPPSSKQARTDAGPVLLTPEQFAAAAGIGIYTVRIWMREGIIVSLPMGLTGRVRRIPAGEVDRVRRLDGNRTAASVQE